MASPTALTIALATLAVQPQQPGPCAAGAGPSVLVSVVGLKSGAGTLRVQAYGPDPESFLKKGRWTRRVDTPLAGRRGLEVCLPLPRPGRYAIAVRHDANGSGRSDWNDGGGFSRNPKITLLRLRPSFEAAAIAVPAGTAHTRVVMNYRRGLSIGPIR